MGGTNFGAAPWQNPTQRGLIKCDSIGWASGKVEDMVGNKACYSSTLSREGSWASVELVGDVMVKPTKYTLSHYTGGNSDCLRSWVFEGSRDGAKWTVIRKHSNDTSLKAKGQSHSWDTPNADEYFNRFKVRMTGKNTYPNWYMMCHALEIYGFVRGHK